MTKPLQPALQPVWTLMKLPNWAQRTLYLDVIDAVEEAGGQARFVGGAVRNHMMRLPVSDVDMATTLKPEAMLEVLKKAKIKAIPTGIEHGTVTAVRGEDKCEITTLREDIETDGRHAKVAFTDDWVADAKRRDFTINTLLMDKKAQVYDPLDKGLEDIKKRTVSFVGEGSKRIQEDALRILRYYRFIALYGDKPDSYTQGICQNYAELVDSLSQERTTEELKKILSVDRSVDVWGFMNEANVLPEIFRKDFEESLFTNLIKFQKRYDLFNLCARFFVLFQSEFAQKDIKLELSFSNKELQFFEDMKKTLKSLSETEDLKLNYLKKKIYEFGREEVLQALLIHFARTGLTTFDEAGLTLLGKWDVPSLPITGKDLQGLGMKEGPEIGKLLTKVEDWWIENNFKPVSEACLEFAKSKL